MAYLRQHFGKTQSGKFFFYSGMTHDVICEETMYVVSPNSDNQLCLYHIKNTNTNGSRLSTEATEEALKKATPLMIIKDYVSVLDDYRMVVMVIDQDDYVHIFHDDNQKPLLADDEHIKARIFTRSGIIDIDGKYRNIYGKIKIHKFYDYYDDNKTVRFDFLDDCIKCYIWQHVDFRIVRDYIHTFLCRLKFELDHPAFVPIENPRELHIIDHNICVVGGHNSLNHYNFSRKTTFNNVIVLTTDSPIVDVKFFRTNPQGGVYYLTEDNKIHKCLKGEDAILVE